MYRIEDNVSAIKEVQKLLGIYKSGSYDTATRNAVIAFQASNGLPESGIADYDTFRLMVKKYREREASVFGSPFLFKPIFPYTLGDMDENTSVINDAIARVLREYFYEDAPPKGRYLNSDTFSGVRYLKEIFGIDATDEIDAYFMNRLAYELDAIEIKEKYR